MKDNYVIVENLDRGWYKREDDTRIPLGGCKEAINITLTPRRGIAPRKGELLYGTASVLTGKVRNLVSTENSNKEKILLKNFADRVEYFSNKISDWTLLKDGYAEVKMGMISGRNDELDVISYTYMGNGIDPFQRWCTWDGQLAGALAGGETSIPVDSTLINDVYETGTATGVTTTTLTVAGTPWATNIWNDFYVRITSGAQAGSISKITATTNNQITFGAIAGLAGTPTFEIRQIAIPETGTLIYNGSTVAYTAVPTDSSLTVASAHASAGADDAITVQPEELADQPRGREFAILYSDLYMTDLPSSPRTVRRSATANFADFTTIGSPRAANEPDIIGVPSSNVIDIADQENALYAGTETEVVAIRYSQDVNDVVQFDRVVTGKGAGLASKFWRLGNDIAYISSDKRITTVGRQVYKDTRPQYSDLADSIRRAIDTYKFDEATGEEFRNFSYVTCKRTESALVNNIVLAYEKDYGSWMGTWTMNASVFEYHDGIMYYGSSTSPDVYQMDAGINKQKDEVTFPMDAFWESGWINGKGNGFSLNEVSSIAIEGYISLNTTINVDLYKDFSDQPFQTLQIVASEDEDLLDGYAVFSVLGGSPLGLEPLGATGGTTGELDEQGRRHFIAYLYFDFTQIEYISARFGSSGKGQNWEVTRWGLNATETVFEAQDRIKN